MMSDPENTVLNTALVGGGAFCKEILEKTVLNVPGKEGIGLHIAAVADPDSDSPGMRFAEMRGIKTVLDYHRLYDPRHQIHVFILLNPDPGILEDILKTKPEDIRVVAYPVFLYFWEIFSGEARKLRERNEEIETILNSIQDFILVITPEMEIVEVNQAFLEQMGYSREEVIGRRCYG